MAREDADGMTRREFLLPVNDTDEQPASRWRELVRDGVTLEMTFTLEWSEQAAEILREMDARGICRKSTIHSIRAGRDA